MLDLDILKILVLFLSHPQVFKKANYYVSLVEHENYVKINDAFVNDQKEVFFCGKTVNASNDEVAFISKFSELGVKEWEKTLESSVGQTYTEFLKLDVNGNNIWVVGQNKPNIQSLDAAYNPDIILAKYVQATDGLECNFKFPKEVMLVFLVLQDLIKLQQLRNILILDILLVVYKYKLSKPTRCIYCFY